MGTKKNLKTLILSSVADNRAILPRIIVGLIFLSEGVQKYLFPELVGTVRFEKIGFSDPAFWAYFNGMYRPHESREDTVLFPAIRKIVSRNEYFALGEDFEHKEHELFGEDGFDSMVGKVAGIEKQLGIYDLAQFTPKM